MRLAVISDIHGNLEAALAVFKDMDAQAPDKIVCLGDSVGYGPDPQAVVDLLAVRDVPQVMGNHEEGLVRSGSKQWFNPLARKALTRTRDLLKPETVAGFKDLPAVITMDDMRFVHGSPPDSIRVYLYELNAEALVRIMSAVPERITFAGHTHELEIITLDKGRISRRTPPKGRTRLEPRARLLVNVGSVGQPRDGNNNAKYVIYDTASGVLDVRYVPYDFEATAAKILARGMHPNYANMLY